MENENTASTRLLELSGSGFEISDDQPDIIGWEIFDSAGDFIGEVEDLIFDQESLKIRYIITDLDGYELDKEKYVLIPIGLVTLHDTDDEVLLTEAVADKLPLLPAYEKGMITPAQEFQIREVLVGTAEHVVDAMNRNLPEDTFYLHGHFDDKGFRKPKV